jgi:hypothetical protein
MLYASLSRSRLLYRRIAEMGFNTAITGVYTTLLKILEQEIGQAVAPGANYSDPQHVDAIASGDTPRAVPVEAGGGKTA